MPGRPRGRTDTRTAQGGRGLRPGRRSRTGAGRKARGDRAPVPVRRRGRTEAALAAVRRGGGSGSGCAGRVDVRVPGPRALRGARRLPGNGGATGDLAERAGRGRGELIRRTGIGSVTKR
ncbi:hypothetical protein SGPA1_12675 [Streptomyces misionensis JCM 4497]